MTAPEPATPEQPEWLLAWLAAASKAGDVESVDIDASTWIVRFGKQREKGTAFPPPPSDRVSEIRLVFTEDWRFRGVDWPEGVSIAVALPRGGVHFAQPSTPARARLFRDGGGGVLDFDNAEPLVAPVFGIENDPQSVPQIKLDTNLKRVFDATGQVTVRMETHTGGVLRGHPGEGVRLLGLMGLGGSAGELENVDIFDLPYDHLGVLSNVQRLSPFWPRHRISGTVNRHDTFDRARQMDMGTDDATLSASRLVEFWDRFVVGLENQHPGGENMAVAREIAYQVRRNSTPWNEPERPLLEAARVFGYGTRVGRPLWVWLAVSTIATAAFVYGFEFPDVDQFFPLLLDVTLTPINFIRGSESALMTDVLEEGSWQRLIVALVRLAGAASIAFTVIAIRTYTRFNR